MGRMSIEEPVKVKTSEDNEKVLVTNSKRSRSLIVNIAATSMIPSSSRTLTKGLSRVFWNATVTIWQNTSLVHLLLSDMFGLQTVAGMFKCNGLEVWQCKKGGAAML